jgi:hypothetical protein
MSSKTSQSNNYYLAITTVISVAVLGGCEYCIPVLTALLLIPMIKLVTRKLIDKTQVNKTRYISQQATFN